MKAKISTALVAMLLALGLAAGCSRSGTSPNDPEIIGQVTTKVQSDPAVQTKAIAIQSKDGVVTLSGQVANDAERNAIAADASQVPGVKTVVNDLTVATAEATPAPAPVEEAKREPVKSSARRHDPPRRRHEYSNSRPAPAPAPAPAPVETAAQTAPVMAPVVPPAPPKPTRITLPEGTQIPVRLIDPLSSKTNQVGDRFRATMAHSLRIDNQIVIPVGADIEGRVVDVKNAAHFSGQSLLAVELTNLSMGGRNYELHTQEIRREGAARGKNTAEKVGGGAALGAIIGAIAGGGKGAAIGSVIGAGAGGGVQAATRGQQIELPTEAVLNFQLASPLTVTPNSRATHSNPQPALTNRTNNNNYTDNNYSDNNNYSDPDSTNRPILEHRPPSDSSNQPN